MIQIYSPSNNALAKNGNAVLFPILCQVTANLNDTWLLEMEAPIDEEGRWKLIEVGAIIKAPSFNGEQLFRIRQTKKQDSGMVVTAEPIFMDAVGDCFILDSRATNKNGQQALDIILAPNSKYSGSSDITKTATAYWVRKNALEAIAGEENGFLERWGGEILYNNYQIIINERVGADYGVALLYGKNIPTDGLSEAVDMEGVVTRIVPKAFNGYILPGSSPWVDSPIINSYPNVMTSVVEYENIKLASDVSEGEDTEGLIICNTMNDLYTALRQAAAEEFDNGIDKPTVTIEADMVMLGQTVEYKDYRNLEEVSLGDTIHCKHNRLGIVTDARVVGLTYDCVRKAVTSVVIGEFKPSFLDRVSTAVQATEKAIRKDGTVKGEQIEGFIDGVMAQLRIQNTVARRQEARAILFEDLDPSSPTFGALAIGTQGLQISRERTSDDRDWVWTTAATSEGIVSGTLIAQDQLAVAKHFFADSSGVHVTEDEYDATTGNNVLIDGNSVDIRQGETTVASFGEIILLGQFPRTTSSNDAYFIIGNGYDEYFLDDIFQLRKNGKLIWGGDANPLDYEMYVTNAQGSEQKVFHEGNLDINQTVGNALTPAHGGTGITNYGLYGGGVNASDSVTTLIPSGGSGFTRVGASGLVNLSVGTTYLVIAYFEFAANATGRRNVALGYFNDQTGEMVIPYRWLRQFEPARDNGPTTVRLVATLTPQSSGLDWDLCAFQDSGGFLNCSVYYQVIALY